MCICSYTIYCIYSGPADKNQLFVFIVFPMLFSCILSGIFLIWSGILVKININKHKKTVSKNATKTMLDLFQRILWYGFGVLFTLSLLTTTAFRFWIKHDKIRNGLNDWIECSLSNYFNNYQQQQLIDCDLQRKLKNNETTISPFWFMSWNISCLMAIIAQIILSFHTKARDRVLKVRQKTIGKLTDVVSDTINSPKSTSSKSISKNINKLDLNEQDTTNTSSIIIPSQNQDKILQTVEMLPSSS